MAQSRVRIAQKFGPEWDGVICGLGVGILFGLDYLMGRNPDLNAKTAPKR